ncbi:MAG TPA: hypothetical protein ENJ51_03370 [Leucothrix mucor]|uniref:Uncharacterized protein n=1 Tax=Leucothrix mucor TaxID=45248 RepID=A0A7V2SYK8_LEUMU|nr:hypothetical protein [Leucothrix mucor]
MPSNAFSTPLKLRFKSSKIMITMIATVHLIVALILVFMAQSLPIIALLYLLVIIASSTYYFYRWHISRTLNKSILELHINSSGDWSLLTFTKKYNNVTPLDSSFSSQYLVIINFSMTTIGQYTLLITNDMISKNEFRRLRVRLKTKQ